MVCDTSGRQATDRCLLVVIYAPTAGLGNRTHVPMHGPPRSFSAGFSPTYSPLRSILRSSQSSMQQSVPANAIAARCVHEAPMDPAALYVDVSPVFCLSASL